MIVGAMQVTNPDGIEVALNVRMTLKEWRELRDQLSLAKWPATRLANAIFDMVAQVEKQFYHHEPTEADK